MNIPLKRSVFSLVLLAASACLASLAQPAQAAALDPNIPMHTLDTPHFRVNYPEGYDAIAQKAARYAEEAHDKVTAYFKTYPKNKTELTLFDHEDTVNGLALPYVNNAMYIYLSTPDADILWGRFDDFLKTVITHEYCHILHFETVDGPSKWVNDVFGRVLFPNLFQPTFLIEGLAVTVESMMIPGGSRGTEAQYDMYLRADALANRLLTIDKAGGYYLTDFPGGDSPYIYGTFFYKYIVHRYGADKPAAIAHAYANAPWLGIDRAVAQVLPGRDAQQIWDEMLHWLERRAQRQIAKIKERPLTQTTAVTETGMNHRHPTYLPNGHLTFVEGLRHSPTALKELVEAPKQAAAAPDAGAQGAAKLPGDKQPLNLKRLFNKSHYGAFDISRDGKHVYYSKPNSKTNYYSYDDLFRFDIETGQSEALTDNMRLSNPGVSPDGERLIAVVNGKGQNNLVLLDKRGKLLKTLTHLTNNTQFTAPHWSPDGKHVVMSTWHQGSRDLFMLDTDTWQAVPLWKDEFIDVGPVWSPDGRYVVFASDREGDVFNLFAYDWEKRELFQMTNVLTGVIEPAISPDGQTVAMSMATGIGYDIHTIPWKPETWRRVATPTFDPSLAAAAAAAAAIVEKPMPGTMPAAPAPKPGGATPAGVSAAAGTAPAAGGAPAVIPASAGEKTAAAPLSGLSLYPSSRYSPLPSLAPKFWLPLYQAGNNTLGVFTIGYDVLLTNTIFGAVGYTVGLPANVPQGSAINPFDLSTYTLLYSNSQFDTNVSLIGTASPFKYAIPLANGQMMELYQRFQNYSLGLGWNNLPSPLTNASYQTGDQTNLSYNVRIISDMTPAAANKEAVDAKLIPPSGRAHSLSYSYKFNSNGKYGYSVAPEYGSMETLGAEVAHPWLGSEVEYYRFVGDWRGFWPLPWTHHTLALRGMAGLNFGKPQGDFYLGGARSVNMAGTPDIRVASDPDDLLVALRGYPFASTSGNTVGLFSAEYRLPLLDVQRGPGTLPFFAERVYGSLFSDSGLAYTNNWLGGIGLNPGNLPPNPSAKAAPGLGDLRTALGAELRLNFKIANNPLNTTPLATIARSAVPVLQAFNDSAGVLRVGIAQPLMPLVAPNGQASVLGPSLYTEFGTFF